MPPDTTIIHALAQRYYTDAAVFARERETVMARTWQFAGHLSQLKNAGDYFVFEVAGDSLFCMHGSDGVIRTFYNVCRHRGHQLLQGAGNVGRITCPYHSWTYQLDGKFKSAPNIRVVAGLDREALCLAAVRTEIFCGFIFVNLDDDAPAMGEWFPGVEEELRAFVPNIDALAPLLWVEIPERCNWKVSVENYSECYHCAINHRSFTSGVIKPESYDIQPRGYCLRHTTECQNLENMSYPIDLTANEHAGEYRSWFLWPTFSFQVYPGNVLNTYHWRPGDVDAVTVWRGWYTPDGEESEQIRAMAKQDRETTVAEDISLVESVQRGLSSRGYQPGPLVLDPKGGVNSEHSIHALHRWIRAAVDGDTATDGN